MTWAGLWPVLVPVIAWAALVVRGPRTRWVDDWPSNGTNYWHGRIVMRRSAPRPAAVWAQEYYEARRKLRRPWETLIRAFLSERLDWIGRSLELMGHEVEVQASAVLYGGAVGGHRRREARSLVRYAQFQGWTVADLEAALGERSAAAAAFVEDHGRRIRAQKKRAEA